MNTRQNPSPIISGFYRRVIRIRMLLSIIRIGKDYYGNLTRATMGLHGIIQKRRKIHGNKFVLKYVRADSRYFTGLNIPGWPSKAFDAFIRNEFIRLDNPKQRYKPLHTAIFSITSRCQMKCKHCYEWRKLTANETLSLKELIRIQQKLHDLGICHLQYSGGEPLARINDLIKLLSHRKTDVDYWVLTSGYELTFTSAKMLKIAGLTGAVISLDHWDEALHNTFRNHNQSFKWARAAIQNCNQAGLATGLSLCAMKEFVSPKNLWKYIELGKQWGVGFIRILEPRQVGRFTNKKILLTKSHYGMLEQFFLEANAFRKYRTYPVVMYPGYHQRKIGCLGAGNRYLYVDSKGDLHACPFCQQPVGNALKDASFENLVEKLRVSGCHIYQTNPYE